MVSIVSSSTCSAASLGPRHRERRATAATEDLRRVHLVGGRGQALELAGGGGAGQVGVVIGALRQVGRKQRHPIIVNRSLAEVPPVGLMVISALELSLARGGAGGLQAGVERLQAGRQ